MLPVAARHRWSKFFYNAKLSSAPAVWNDCVAMWVWYVMKRGLAVGLQWVWVGDIYMSESHTSFRFREARCQVSQEHHGNTWVQARPRYPLGEGWWIPGAQMTWRFPQLWRNWLWFLGPTWPCCFVRTYIHIFTYIQKSIYTYTYICYINNYNEL